MARRITNTSDNQTTNQSNQVERLGAHQMFLINYKGDKHLIGNISVQIRAQFKNVKLN